MSSERTERLKALFGAALEHQPAERDAWLGAHCGDDPALRAEVLELLAHHERAEPYFAALEHELAPVRGAELDAHWGVDRMLGAYRIERRLGAGGMGVVYLAQRADGRFERQVAIKLLPLGAESPLARERFEREQRILARLVHPHIAQLLDAGVSDDGRPYLVMEYVEGESLDGHADARRLNLHARVALVATIAEAVQYAHQNLVVHRDLKPGNVLVGADGEPKLLDFGVARLLDVPTQTQAPAFTPAYAAPEQVRGEAPTTATDVYALGVILCEQLSGSRPPRAGTDAELPSALAARSDTANAQRRATTPAALARALGGELDLIVAKAAHADPAHRYGSAAQLADDLRRWLAGRPVLARPDAVAYRAGKFVRRHPVASTAAVVALAGLIAFGLYQRQQAAALARERDRAERVAAMLVDVFASADPTRARGHTVTARELLDRGVSRVLAGLESQPDVAAELALVLGRSYQGLGETGAAEPLLDSAIVAYRGAGSAEALARALVHRGENDRLAGKLPEAVVRFREALALVDDAAAHAAVRAWIQGKLGRVLGLIGQRDEARALIAAALAQARTAQPVDREVLAERLNDTASLDFAEGRYAGAEAHLREVVAQRRGIDTERGGAAGPETATALNNLGLALQAQGRPVGAEPLLREALAIRQGVLAPQHPELAQTLSNLGLLLQARGALDEAEPMLREALAIRANAFGARHALVAQARNNLGLLLHARGDFVGAQAELEAALADLVALHGERHPLVAMAHSNLGGVALDSAALGEAESHYAQSLELRRALLPANHPHLAYSLVGLARVRLAQGNEGNALAFAEEAARLRAQLPQSDPLRAEADCALALIRGAGKASPVAAQAAAVLAQAPPPLVRFAAACARQP